MMCVKCKAQKITPSKTCFAGVEPFMLKCGHLGCVYNSAQVEKGMREHADRFPVRNAKAAELTDKELVALFEEISRWKNTGKLDGEKLRSAAEEWFGPDAGMLTATEGYVLYEMARRYANSKRN